jgi:hypothetical protein
VGTLQGVGRIDQPPCIDTSAKVGFAELYDRTTPLTAADLLNDRVLLVYETHALPLGRVLPNRGTAYCGRPDRHEYELYLAVEDIDHTRTKTRSPQTNGICERFRDKADGKGNDSGWLANVPDAGVNPLEAFSGPNKEMLRNFIEHCREEGGLWLY